jgi:ribonuclease HI
MFAIQPCFSVTTNENMRYLQTRGWRTSDGKRPANLDLFMKLDECVTNIEQGNVEVGFLRIPGAHNRKADSLAKRATNIYQ